MRITNLGLQFKAVAERFPSQAALRFHKEPPVTYERLDRDANRSAHYLFNAGVRRGDVIALAGVKTPRIFGLLIGALKIGAIYTFVDPETPSERLRHILGVCTPKIFFIDESLEMTLQGADEALGGRTVPLHSEGFAADIDRQTDQEPSGTTQVIGSDPAYIMFTSGSTGIPKGAVMSHANVLNLIAWSRERFSITEEDVLTNVNPIFFDNSVFDIYSALFTGASLAPMPKGLVIDAGALVAAVDELRCSIWFSVPSLLIYLSAMKALTRDKLKSIRVFIFGGEGYPLPKLRALFDLYSQRAKLVNVYGPTECTCICSAYDISASDFQDEAKLPPIGRLIKNFDYRILDDGLRPIPAGEIGELCLLGPNVGQGYYNDPERTGKSFIHNHGLMYKTGDLFRQDPETGTLHIVGRKDNQIKHMGYRIELEEIDVALCRLSSVKQAVSFQASIKGFSKIVSVVSKREPDVSAKSIRQGLSAFLPPYMIPSVIYFEDELPKNPNGKVDRRGIMGKYSRDLQS